MAGPSGAVAVDSVVDSAAGVVVPRGAGAVVSEVAGALLAAAAAASAEEVAVVDLVAEDGAEVVSAEVDDDHVDDDTPGFSHASVPRPILPPLPPPLFFLSHFIWFMRYGKLGVQDWLIRLLTVYLAKFLRGELVQRKKTK